MSVTKNPIIFFYKKKIGSKKILIMYTLLILYTRDPCRYTVKISQGGAYSYCFFSVRHIKTDAQFFFELYRAWAHHIYLNSIGDYVQSPDGSIGTPIATHLFLAGQCL